MKKFFTAIRKNDIETVSNMLQRKPELIKCVAKQPPKKDDGQSPLQVAFKVGNFQIVELLLSLGADINFIESEQCCNDWRAPVIHDAINAAIMCSRWNTNSNILGLKVQSTKEKADLSFKMLEKVINLGADVNAKDSFGNSCIWRACLQARQILPTYNNTENILKDDRIFTDELRADLSRIFKLLIKNGADLNYISPNCKKLVYEQYKNEPVCEFIKL